MICTASYALQADEIDHIVVFGDSLSDAGYLDLFPRPLGKSPTYTNGKVWPQYLSLSLLHKPITSNNLNPIISPKVGFADGKSAGFDYAAGGAVTNGEGIINWPEHYVPPSLERQITQFEIQHHNSEGKIDPDNLYIIWVGSNNLLRVYADNSDNTVKFLIKLFPAADQAVDFITLQVKRLHDLGAKHIVVIDYPNQGITPLLNQKIFLRDFYQFLTARMNSRLYEELTPKKLGFYVKIVKINRELLAVIDSKSHTVTLGDTTFHFDNVTEPGCDYRLEAQTAFAAKLAIACIVPPAHNHYLFSDAVHPSSYAHQLIATAIQQEILADNQL